jgi:hypothetical protein
MTPPWIESLIDDPDQPITNVMLVIYNSGLDPVLDELFQEGARCQHSNPERAMACAKLIDRINKHTQPPGIGGMTSSGFRSPDGREDAGG